MTLPRTVADVLFDHVTLEVECIDRLYLNVYQPRLQYPAGATSEWAARRIDSMRRDEARAAVDELGTMDRLLCRGIVVRQLTRGTRIAREGAGYGPRGVVLLCAARSYGVYVLLLGPVCVGLAIAGSTRLAAFTYLVIFALSTLGVARSIAAARAGRKWRASRQ